MQARRCLAAAAGDVDAAKLAPDQCDQQQDEAGIDSDQRECGRVVRGDRRDADQYGKRHRRADQRAEDRDHAGQDEQATSFGRRRVGIGRRSEHR